MSCQIQLQPSIPKATEWIFHPEAFHWVCQRWWMPNMDQFTTRFNRQLPMYVSPVPDPQTLDVDTILIPRVLQLFQKFLCFLLVIFPKWSNWLWSTDLLCLADSNPLPLPDLDQLFHLIAQTAPSEFKIVPTTCLDITSKQLKKKGFSTASSQAILGLFMNYVAKNQMSDQASQVYMVQALSSILSEQDKEDFFLCHMRALKFYNDRTHSFCQNRKRLIKVWNKFFPVTSQKTPSLTGYGWTLSMPMKMKSCLWHFRLFWLCMLSLDLVIILVMVNLHGQVNY